MDWLRNLTATSPDWLPFSPSLPPPYVYMIYDYHFNIIYLNLLTLLLKHIKGEQLIA
jgi:hypothetical protein